jgi:hypothetical protein
MDATHHPVFPLSPQLVFEWFINRDIKRLEFFVKLPGMTTILEYLFTIVLISGVKRALHESNINRDFGLKKKPFFSFATHSPTKTS